jgi:hypothetical protein
MHRHPAFATLIESVFHIIKREFLTIAKYMDFTPETEGWLARFIGENNANDLYQTYYRKIWVVAKQFFQWWFNWCQYDGPAVFALVELPEFEDDGDEFMRPCLIPCRGAFPMFSGRFNV